MMRARRRIALSLLLLAAWCISAGHACAEKRVALIIGNSTYDKVARLPNTANDAALMAETFKSAGFDSVDLRRDLKVGDMRRALRDFTDKSRDADVAVVFYAGHGIEVDGNNYLVPVDAVLERDVDIYDEALSLERVLIAVEPAKQLRLIILDACRDNPFIRSMKRTLASRAVGRGLARVEPTGPNTLIAFASKAGSTASEGDGANSPFTAAVVKHLTQPGLDLRKAFGYVRDDVLKSTGNRQEPYVYGSLGGDDFPLVPSKPVATGPQADPQAAVRRDYELALQLGTRDGWEAFLSQYAEGFYANLAKGQLKKIAAEELRLAAVEKVRQAEQDKARLAAEGARQAEQAKAAANAKAAEEARSAAERVKAIEQEKATAAEQARLAAEKVAAEKKEQLATLTPPGEKTEQPVDLVRKLQGELRRVGCGTDTDDGNWSGASQKALDRFNKHSGMKLDVKAASTDALDAVKRKAGRVCPVICESGYRADGDRCVKIACRAGYQPGQDNKCQRIERRNIANRPDEQRAPETQAVPRLAFPSAVARADAAYERGAYQSCMGARSGCYERSISGRMFRGDPESARRWCTRRPTC
jgi:uncharacterized caspase-like protein